MGRVILLGDGTEVPADHADSEMFDDNDDEHKDLVSQVRDEAGSRREREGTPGPEDPIERTKTPELTNENVHPHTPSSTKAEPSSTPHESKFQPVVDSPLPPTQSSSSQ